MPYEVTFTGDYFQTAKLFGGLDGMVHLRKGSFGFGFTTPQVNGRLVTINSFSLATDGTSANPPLQGTLSMTTLPGSGRPGSGGRRDSDLAGAGDRARDDASEHIPGRRRGDGDAMNDLRPPKILSDLYRDLRDRRLIIIVVGLLVALVAVPVLLANKRVPTPVPPTPHAAVASGDLAVPAVALASQPGVSNYRKRLERFQTKNPFRQQFVASPRGSGLHSSADSSTAISSTAISSTATSSGSTSTSDTSTTATTTTPTATTPTTPTGPSHHANHHSGGRNAGGSGGVSVRTVTRLFSRRVDLTVGPDGSPRTIKGVKPMSILPSKKVPALGFLGTDEAGKNAAFVLSARSTATGGTASCVPSPDNCIYVTMRKGQTLTVDYTPDSSTTPVSYELALDRIRDVSVKSPEVRRGTSGN